MRKRDLPRAQLDGVLDLLRGTPLEFILLVSALSVPLWVFGDRPLPLPMNLPVSSLQWVLPLVVALILVLRREGRRRARRLLKRILDANKIKPVWYLPIVFLPPLVLLLTYAIMRVLGRPLPDPRIAIGLIPVLLIAFLVAGVFEEVGWMGYVFERMPPQWSALMAGIVLGLVHSVWHAVPHLEQGHPPSWIAWKVLETTSLRVLTVWLYNNTNKSIFAAVFFHATYNVAWVLFPNDGSHYDPAVGGTLFAIAAAIVTLVWGPRTLTERPSSGARVETGGTRSS